MKDIENYEGLYAVTSCGKVYSYRSKKFLKPRNYRGYLGVVLCKDGKRKDYLIHRLVAAAYIPNSDNLPLVNHKDENKHNNALNNLEWCTQKYNLNYGTAKERANQKKFKKCQCVETGEIFNSYKEAAEAKGICNGSQIGSVINGKRKTAGGYHWTTYSKEE